MLGERSTESSQFRNIEGLGSSKTFQGTGSARPVGTELHPRSLDTLWSNNASSSHHSSKPQSPFTLAVPDDGTTKNLPFRATLGLQKLPALESSRWSRWPKESKDASRSYNASAATQTAARAPYEGVRGGSRHFGTDATASYPNAPYSNQQIGAEPRKTLSALAPGFQRPVDRLTSKGTSDTVSMPWAEASLNRISSQPDQLYRDSSWAQPPNQSNDFVTKHGNSSLRTPIDATLREDFFYKYTNRPASEETASARPTVTRHASDFDGVPSLARLSMTDGQSPSAFSYKAPEFGTRANPSPQESVFAFSGDGFRANTELRSTSASAYRQHQSTYNYDDMSNSRDAFGLKPAFGNPAVSPFYPQTTPPETLTPTSRNGSWQADLQTRVTSGAQTQQLFAQAPRETQAAQYYWDPALAFQQIMPTQSQPQRAIAQPQLQAMYAMQPQMQPQMQIQVPLNPMQVMGQYQMSPYQNFVANGMLQQMAMPQMTTFPPTQKPEAPVQSSMASQNGHTGPTSGTDYMSHRMKEFRTQKSRRWELSELVGHLVELAGDQGGSRWLQNFMASASTQEKAKVFEELFPNALQLMQDVFGNYVIQKIFEYGDQTQKKMLGKVLQNHIATFSLSMYGCRVVQKAFEHVLADQQAVLVSELNRPGLVFQCIDDQHGNHVIQKAIEVVPSHVITFIYDEILGRVVSLAEHSYGCRIVQRMLEQPDPHIRKLVLKELKPSGEKLITSTYGNYVAQHIIGHGDKEHREWMKELVFRSVRMYGRDKFASNVVEMCIKEGTDAERKFILDKVMEVDHSQVPGETGMAQFLKCPFGNYVVQKFIEYLTKEDRRRFLSHLHQVIGQHRGSISKRILDEIDAKLNPSNARSTVSRAKDVRTHSRQGSRGSGDLHQRAPKSQPSLIPRPNQAERVLSIETVRALSPKHAKMAAPAMAGAVDAADTASQGATPPPSADGSVSPPIPDADILLMLGGSAPKSAT